MDEGELRNCSGKFPTGVLMGKFKCEFIYLGYLGSPARFSINS